MIARFALVASLVLLGCGSSDSEPEVPVPAPPAPVQKAPAYTPEQLQEVLPQIWSWPADKGPPRDVVADHAACDERIQAEPGYAQQAPLQRFVAHARCMQELGWVQRQPPAAGG